MESDFKISFDGVEITKFLDLTELPDFGILPPVEIELVQHQNRNGSRMVNKRYASRSVPFEFILSAENINNAKDELVQILNKKEPVPLILSTMPDRYWNAIIDGETSYIRRENTTSQVDVKLTFLIPDGMAHASTQKTFTFAPPTYTVQPTKYKEGDVWLVAEGDLVTVKSDFKGKVAGSLVENPNILKFGANSLQDLNPPTGSFFEVNQTQYSASSSLDGVLFVRDLSNPGAIAQILVEYNELEKAKRAFPSIFEGLSVDAQVTKLKNMEPVFNSISWAKSTSPAEKRLNFSVWAQNSWRYTTNSTSGVVSELTLANSSFILNEQGRLFYLIHGQASGGASSSSKIELDYLELETTFKNPFVNQYLVATKDSDTFNMADWELVEEPQTVELENEGTYQTPVDIYCKFATHTKSIGFVSDSILIQLGNTDSTDVPTTPLSEVFLIDKMENSSKSRWQTNIAQPRWRKDDPEYPSKVMGSMTWLGYAARATGFGGRIPDGDKWYWRGPSLTWNFGQDIENPEIKTWFAFESSGKGKPRMEQKGLFEANIYDRDNNAVMGFEMKDNTNVSDEITYSLFIGDYQIYKDSLPRKYWGQGFVGMIELQKKGSQFYFKLIRTKVVRGKTIEEWSSRPFTFTNEVVAGLKGARIDYWFSTWGNAKAVNMQVAHVQARKYNTVDKTYAPVTFEEGDEVFVEGSTNFVYLNGERFDKVRVLGSDQLFISQPGKTEVTVSTDGVLSDLNLSLRERFL